LPPIAVIDIGTNTVLLLAARLGEDGTITPLLYEQRIPRLGRGVDSSRSLHSDGMNRVVAVVQEYAALIAPLAPSPVIVCGTSAVRDAANREELSRRILAGTGWTLEVLTGDEEAFWTYRGAVSGIPGSGRTTVADIGGGSTELTVGDGTTIAERISLDIGSVRLTERCFHHDPPTLLELETAIEYVENEIARAASFPFKGTTLVGVAGTATSLALLASGTTTFDVAAVTNIPIERETVEVLFRRLRATSSSEILKLSPAMEGRSDVITAGSLILREIMAHCGFASMIVSERGLRYGLILREAEKGLAGVDEIRAS
jgi:exopolyphosphatase / guanosine-5'-triphosphate,3'-diphosphate pyrophosphatase